MKKLLLAGLMMPAAVIGVTVVDGKGFFPVTVQVVRARDAKPVPGAMVKLEDLRPYVETELDPAKQPTVMRELLGKPVPTDAAGIASVVYHGSWHETKVDGERASYGRSLEGTVVVTFDGKEIHRVSLKDWAKGHQYQSQPHSAPWILIELPEAP